MAAAQSNPITLNTVRAPSTGNIELHEVCRAETAFAIASTGVTPVKDWSAAVVCRATPAVPRQPNHFQVSGPPAPPHDVYHPAPTDAPARQAHPKNRTPSAAGAFTRRAAQGRGGTVPHGWATASPTSRRPSMSASLWAHDECGQHQRAPAPRSTPRRDLDPARAREGVAPTTSARPPLPAGAVTGCPQGFRARMPCRARRRSTGTWGRKVKGCWSIWSAAWC